MAMRSRSSIFIQHVRVRLSAMMRRIVTSPKMTLVIECGYGPVLCAYRLSDSLRNLIGKRLHLFCVFGLDHNSRQGLGARIADDHASIAVEFTLGGCNRTLY